MQPAPQRFRHLVPGDKLGNYELIRQIAIGGMAELYLARTVGLEGFEKLVVVKRILPQLATNVHFVNMFLNEARLAATLQHANVATVYDVGVDDGDYFFAMEYVHGEDLDRISLQSHDQGVPLSMDFALTLIAGLCAGLHYAHDKVGVDGRALQIVHRDVSPSNVLVSYDGSVKLVDFGIARAFANKGRSNQTPQHGLKGKITYMSPEQCRADAVLDRRSDIYSIGTLLYELTVGRVPFTGETEYAILNQIVNADVPPPSMFVPGYPPGLEGIVLRALARDADQRYSTAIQLQGEIEDFAHENRLRISPLVLARIMGTLFPAKLEEWDTAKSQGAFFVEQHVVRTLIESGRTPAPNDPKVQAVLAELQQAREEALGDRPVVNHPPTWVPGPHPHATPVPGQPGAVPIVPVPGTLVSHPSKPSEPPHGQLEVTARVPRLPTQPQLAKGRAPMFAVAALVLVGGGVASFIAFGGSSDDKPERAVEVKANARPPEPAPQHEAKLADPPTTHPIEATTPAPKPDLKPEPKPEPKPEQKVAKKPHGHRKTPKPDLKPEEKPWNADSPFMPVRTDKH